MPPITASAPDVVAKLTILIPLNQNGEDYHGGLWNFPKYNCSIQHWPRGRLLIIPSTLTHYFEVNPVTKGTFAYLTASLGAHEDRCYMKYGKFECIGFKRIKILQV